MRGPAGGPVQPSSPASHERSVFGCRVLRRLSVFHEVFCRCHASAPRGLAVHGLHRACPQRPFAPGSNAVFRRPYHHSSAAERTAFTGHVRSGLFAPGSNAVSRRPYHHLSVAFTAFTGYVPSRLQLVDFPTRLRDNAMRLRCGCVRSPRAGTLSSNPLSRFDASLTFGHPLPHRSPWSSVASFPPSCTTT
jgi:hypothetical protein